MINKQFNTIKCDNCGEIMDINKEKLRKWCTRRYVNRLEKANKHYCPRCADKFGFYANGVVIL